MYSECNIELTGCRQDTNRREAGSVSGTAVRSVRVQSTQICAVRQVSRFQDRAINIWIEKLAFSSVVIIIDEDSVMGAMGSMVLKDLGD